MFTAALVLIAASIGLVVERNTHDLLLYLGQDSPPRDADRSTALSTAFTIPNHFQDLRLLGLPSATSPLMFIHLPKCAGTSIRTSLFARFGSSSEEDASHMCIPSFHGLSPGTFQMSRCKPRRGAGRTMSVVAGHFDYTDTLSTLMMTNKLTKSSDVKCITYIREPLARTVSFYYFYLKLVRHSRRAPVLQSLPAQEAVDLLATLGLRGRWLLRSGLLHCCALPFLL